MPEDDLPKDSLIGHLSDLRNCLIKSLLAVGVLFFALFPFHDQIYGAFVEPLTATLPEESSLIATSVLGAFLVPIKVVLFCAFCIALPYVLYQVWSFVAPGLYKNEKRFILPLVASSTLLFYAGMVFAYFLVFKVVFTFIVQFAPQVVNVMPDVQSHLSFALTIFLVFGIAFEVPIAVFLLVYLGVVEISKLKHARPYVIIGSFITAAIFTPPDVLSQFMLAIPVCLLYEVGILVSWFALRNRNQSAADPSASSKA